MKADKITKLLLAAITVALWMLAINPWLHPMPVSAQDRDEMREVESQLSSIQSVLSSIESDLGSIETGRCLNSKICVDRSK